MRIMYIYWLVDIVMEIHKKLGWNARVAVWLIQFFAGIHPDDDMYRKTLELEILTKNYKDR